MNEIFSHKEFDLKKQRTHIVFICDHASNFIPKSFKNLGKYFKLATTIGFTLVLQD